MLNLEIDVAAAIYNISVIRRHTDAEISAVIKANCYGLGLPLAKYIEDYVDSFSVSSIGEAKEARAIGIRKKIYILGIINPIEFEPLENVVHTICSEEDIDFLRSYQNDFDIALKINTGMNRLGASLTNVSDLIKSVSKTKNLQLDSMYTHFYNVDGNSHKSQFELFEKAVAGINAKKHCCASNCLKVDKKYHMDMVRCGLAIYGYGHNQLLPSLSAFSTVAQINFVKAGEYVGYGSFCLEQDAKIAVIRTGYADGYRRLQKSHYASTGGKLAKIVGQISMDMAAVDVSGMDIKKNDKIYLIDKNISIDSLAIAADTIVYEILTSFNGLRIRRIYKNK